MNKNAKKGIVKSVVFCILAFFCLAFQTWAGELTPDKDNELLFKNFENVFDSNGQYKAPGTEMVVGDHLVGIICVQNIDVEGTITWFQSVTDQLTGIFATRVEAIVDPDDYDPLGEQALPHLVLGTPTVNLFCKGEDCFSTAELLQPGEIFAFFRDQDAPVAPFESDGDMEDDVENATDGELWLTLGYRAGHNKKYGTDDDDGYFYTHNALEAILENFTGEAWAGLNAMRNHTGYAFGGINDPSELEIGDILIPGLLNDIYLSSELEPNPNSVNMDQEPTIPGHQPGTSPWDIRSNDPAHMLPTEEVLEGPCRMTGGGVDIDGEIIFGTLANDRYDRDRYQFGGQVGAPTGSPPQPYGEWTHHQQKGPHDSFTFHAGTSSAPYGTEILTLVCSDPGFCNPARPAPFKQIDFDGIGSFKNVKGALGGVVIPGETLHYFRSHVEDIGDAGPGGKQPKSDDCEHVPGTPIVVPDDCENCADVYQIEIHLTDDPGSDVIYTVGGFINGGNLQIHPAID